MLRAGNGAIASGTGCVAATAPHTLSTSYVAISQLFEEFTYRYESSGGVRESVLVDVPPSGWKDFTDNVNVVRGGVGLHCVLLARQCSRDSPLHALALERKACFVGFRGRHAPLPSMGKSLLPRDTSADAFSCEAL